MLGYYSLKNVFKGPASASTSDTTGNLLATPYASSTPAQTNPVTPASTVTPSPVTAAGGSPSFGTFGTKTGHPYTGHYAGGGTYNGPTAASLGINPNAGELTGFDVGDLPEVTAPYGTPEWRHQFAARQDAEERAMRGGATAADVLKARGQTGQKESGLHFVTEYGTGGFGINPGGADMAHVYDGTQKLNVATHTGDSAGQLPGSHLVTNPDGTQSWHFDSSNPDAWATGGEAMSQADYDAIAQAAKWRNEGFTSYADVLRAQGMHDMVYGGHGTSAGHYTPLPGSHGLFYNYAGNDPNRLVVVDERGNQVGLPPGVAPPPLHGGGSAGSTSSSAPSFQTFGGSSPAASTTGSAGTQSAYSNGYAPFTGGTGGTAGTGGSATSGPWGKPPKDFDPNSGSPEFLHDGGTSMPSGFNAGQTAWGAAGAAGAEGPSFMQFPEWDGGGFTGFDPGPAPQFHAPEYHLPTWEDAQAQDPFIGRRMQIGLDAMERQAAAKGILQTGGTLADEQAYGQDFASNEYANAVNRSQGAYGLNFNRLKEMFGPKFQAWQDRYTAGATDARFAADQALQRYLARVNFYNNLNSDASGLVGGF